MKVMMVSGAPTSSPEGAAALADIAAAAQRRIALSTEERRDLARLEGEISESLRAFQRVGLALMEIRERQLYRATHETFEAYCADRWRITDRRARQIVAATQVKEKMQPLLADGASLDQASEYALRPLAELEPQQAAEAWALATELAGGEVPGHDQTAAAAAAVKKSTTPAVLHSSKDSEYYTPKKYRAAILRALQVARKVDLDPCADPGKTFPARRHFTADDDALTQDWRAETLYMNPPWAERQAPTWADKFRAELDAVHFLRAVCLLPGRIDTAWLQKVMKPEVMCLVSGRVTFVNATDPAGFPVVFTGHGVPIDLFAEAFAEHGEIWVPHRRRRKA